jgi:hypothetical protein
MNQFFSPDVPLGTRDFKGNTICHAMLGQSVFNFKIILDFLMDFLKTAGPSLSSF